MKKLFVVLAAILLLAIIACSSKGSSSSSSSSTTTSATVNSTGGSVQLADGANVTIPAGVVADNSSVTLTKLAQPQLYASQATAVTDSYQITIPAGSITTQSSGSNNVITFQIPIPTSISASVKKVLSHMKAMVSDSIPDDAYYASELNITNSTSTNALYGTYFVSSSGMLNINAPVGAFTTSGSTAITTQATVTGLNMINYYSVQTSLNGVTPSTTGSSPTFPPVSCTNIINGICSSYDQTTILAGKTPIILIHGWQIFTKNTYPMQDCWDDFINYFNLDSSSLKGNYKLYSFDYPTAGHVETNAQNLESIISSYFPSQKVVIIAHSMGGLVAHSYIQEYGGGSKVLKLITLGTPYHGSPLMQYLHYTYEGLAILDLTNSFLALTTPGSLDLQWDNYIYDSGIQTPSAPYYLTTLFNDLKTQYANLYCAFAGSINPAADGENIQSPLFLFYGLYPHGYYDVFGAILQGYGNGYPSDGVVPLVSAVANDSNGNPPSGFVIKDLEVDYDHSQMTGKSSTDQLFDQIESVLTALLPSSYNISGIITDSNSKPLSGVTVYLSGGSSSANTITDVYGNYSFNVAYGTYTLTPVLAGYAFNPASTGVNADGTNANFIISNITATANPVPTYNISGTVTLNSVGLAGVTITLTGSGSIPTTTDSYGNYTFTGAQNGSYTVTPSMTGYTFSPASSPANVSGANFTVPDFVATASGTVTEFSAGISADACPYDITVGPDGNLWFTEFYGNRIGRITPTGVVTEFSAGITDKAGLYGITVGPDGNLWFTEYLGNRIGRITPTGVVTEFSAGITDKACPYAITVGPDGNLWFTESGGYGIGRITPTGVVTEFSVGTPGFCYDGICNNGLYGITVGPDGNLWFTEYLGNRIGRITPTGVVTEFSAGITDKADPWGITVGPDGNLWFTESAGYRIGRITPTGVVTEFSAGIITDNAHLYGITVGPDSNLWFTESAGIGRITP